jgi:hypothetical protein
MTYSVDDDEVVLRPPSGRSPEEREALSKNYEHVSELPKPEPNRIRFSISGLLIITFAVALGLSGRSWSSPAMFAGLIGIVANIVYFSIELNEVDEPKAKLIAAALCIASGVAIVVALLG